MGGKYQFEMTVDLPDQCQYLYFRYIVVFHINRVDSHRWIVIIARVLILVIDRKYYGAYARERWLLRGACKRS